MDFNTVRARELLEHADFVTLFVEELGWDRHSDRFELTVAGETFIFRAVAEKKGATAFVCDVEDVPQKALRLKIDREISKRAFEHIVVFSAQGGAQVWNWPRRLPDRPVSLMDHAYRPGEQNTAFLQRLRGISFSLAEENDLTLPDVTKKLDASLNAEKVTKRFFADFSSEHAKFLGFIQGIVEVADRDWYASLMLNRLMFIYFMQRKGFLDGNINYLRDKLAECQSREGQDQFYPFYRYFLLRLFHEGLGGKERKAELEKLIGRVPYLNGGLFEKHLVEERNPDIQIPDEAFERIFNYFDRYKWHLDERPLRDENEINPDVLGYIFEKYINQKQMGAYYTKEDITGYISQNTAIPFLLDATKVECRVAFENPGGPTVWDHLRDEPDRYIYKSVRHGMDCTLPDNIRAGVGDVSLRSDWNRTAPEEFGLPTEIWREVVARRARCDELRGKMAAGEVHEVNDLIALNLDIRQFAQDVVDRAEGPDLLRAFWKAVERVTVLDPTCGSGAFLFAALNVLEPLYEACLDRMESFVTDLERSEGGQGSKRFEDFRKILARVEAHPNRRYFILKSIILNNLFGVDIMEEAVEICKLRLFLKLAAQVDPDSRHDNLGIEPLPDIDFNMRAGNSLVGYSLLREVTARRAPTFDFDDSIGRINRAAADAQQAQDIFRARQIEGDGSVPVADKATLRTRLAALDEVLNLQLAAEYGVKVGDVTAVDAWVKGHQPFHWLIEFHGIMSRGGFDVIIGNPPYVEVTKIDGYKLPPGAYSTATCGNIYAPICERSYRLLRPGGRFGMIVPISCVSTERMEPLRRLWTELKIQTHASFYSGDAHPSVLFTGVKFRLAILLQEIWSQTPDYQSTMFQRWFSEARGELFGNISYVKSGEKFRASGLMPKLGSAVYRDIVSRLSSQDKTLGSALKGSSPHRVYSHRIVAHFIKAMDFVPYFRSDRDGQKRSDDYKLFCVDSELSMHALSAVLNSTSFYLWFVAYSDVYHCGREIIETFPLDLDDLVLKLGDQLHSANLALTASLRANSVRRSIRYKKTGLVDYDEFYPRKSKRYIDDIDILLASYFGFTDTETDYVLNYDVKFRLGADDTPEDAA
jgi:hypothetical protein